MKKRILALSVCALAVFAGCTTSGVSHDKPVNVHGEPLSGLDVEFPLGMLRAVFTLCQTPLEVPRAAAVILSSDDKQDTPLFAKVITLPITLSVGSAVFCSARALGGGFDLLTFGLCGEVFYGNLIAPFIWEEQWVGTIKSTEDCILEAKMRNNASIPPDPPSERVTAAAPAVEPSKPAVQPVSPVVESDPPAARPVVTPEERRDGRYCGNWEVAQVSVTKMSGVGIATARETVSVLKSKYTFFDDGKFSVVTVVSGRETAERGRWMNEDGCLVMRFDKKSGKETVFRLRPEWNSVDEFEMRHDDLDEFAKALIVTDSIKSAKARYGQDGMLHIRMKLQNHTVEQTLHPWIFIRAGGGDK